MLSGDLCAATTATSLHPPPLLTKNDEILEKGILNKYSAKRLFPKAVKKSVSNSTLAIKGTAGC